MSRSRGYLCALPTKQLFGNNFWRENLLCLVFCWLLQIITLCVKKQHIFWFSLAFRAPQSLSTSTSDAFLKTLKLKRWLSLIFVEFLWISLDFFEFAHRWLCWPAPLVPPQQTEHCDSNVAQMVITSTWKELITNTCKELMFPHNLLWGDHPVWVFQSAPACNGNGWGQYGPELPRIYQDRTAAHLIRFYFQYGRSFHT